MHLATTTSGMILVIALGLGNPAYLEQASTSACPSSAVTIEDIADGLNAVECDVVGAPIQFGSIGSVVPELGEFVGAAAISDGGTESVLTIEVTTDGAVNAYLEVPEGTNTKLKQRSARRTPGRRGKGAVHFSSPVVQSGGTSAASKGKCTDAAYTKHGKKWSGGKTSYLINNTEGLVAGVTSTQFASAIMGASYTIGAGVNSCGLSSAPKLNITVGAYTTANSNIAGAENRCSATNDGKNVIDFGNLTGGTLALACWRGSGSSISSADIRIDNTSRSWAAPGATCSGSKYDLQGVLTHEFGHFVGLGHTSEHGRGDLVMSPSSGPCDTTQRKLGKGDLLGLLSLY